MKKGEIYLTRLTDNKVQTEGFLTVSDGNRLHSFFTLELPWMNNAEDVSCIPPGVYPWAKYESPSFKTTVLLLDLVPMRKMIELHYGNYYHNTDGCILIGNGFTDINNDGFKDVTDSRNALKDIISLLPDEGMIRINYINER